jgi:hypothetical protein
MESKTHYDFLAQFTVPELKKIISRIKKDFVEHFKGYGKIKDKDELIGLILAKYAIDEEQLAKQKYANVEDIFMKREQKEKAKEAKKLQVKEGKKTAKMSKEREARLAEKVKNFLAGDEKIDFSNKEDIKNMKKSRKQVPEEDRIF